MTGTLIWFLLYSHSYKVTYASTALDKEKSSLTVFSIISCLSLQFSVQVEEFMQQHNLTNEVKISLETKGK